MLKKEGVKNYQNCDEFLAISPLDLNRPVHFKDEKEAMPPIFFAIKYGRNDIVEKLRNKTPQKQQAGRTTATADPIHYATNLAMNALHDRNIRAFISLLHMLTLLGESSEQCNVLISEMDKLLAQLPEKDFKLAILDLLGQLPSDTNSELSTLLYCSPYLIYLTSALGGNRKVAEEEFNPDQLRVLNEVGFSNAKRNRNNKLARLFIKQALQQKGGDQQEIVFAQGLYLDNLDYAVRLINKIEGTQLKADVEGICSAFTKYWIFNEVASQNELDRQSEFFRKIMRIASLSPQEIEKKIKTDPAFVQRIKESIANIDVVQHSRRYEGLTQRTMKKQFGLELIDEYPMRFFNASLPKLFYISIKYKSGSGHALGVHIQRITTPDKQTAMLYKVWDSNSRPQTFKTREELMAYLEHFQANPKISSMRVYEFSPLNVPSTKAKVDVIDAFIKATEKLAYPTHSHQAAIVDCIKNLAVDYDNGIIALNELVPLLALMGHKLNKLNGNKDVDISGLREVIHDYNLTRYKKLDLDKVSFIHDFIHTALQQNKPHIVTALFDLGLSEKDQYSKFKQTEQEMVLRQSIIEGNKSLFNYLLTLQKTEPPTSLVLAEIRNDPHNKHCQEMLAHLLLRGETFSDSQYPLLEKRLQLGSSSTSFLSKINQPPLKEIIKQTIVRQIITEIANNANKCLGPDDTTLLVMLDAALNPAHQGKRGCHDILTFSSIYSVMETDARERIRGALEKYDISIDKSQQSKYPYIFKFITAYQMAKPVV